MPAQARPDRRLPAWARLAWLAPAWLTPGWGVAVHLRPVARWPDLVLPVQAMSAQLAARAPEPRSRPKSGGDDRRRVTPFLVTICSPW